MHKIILFAFVILSLFSPSYLLADAKSDYEYQLTQYRKNYAEFSLLKRDYFSNPTLDNSQKSLISAKQLIKSRDLSKYSFARYLLEQIQKNNVGEVYFQPIVSRLNEAISFYSLSADKSQNISTIAELAVFSESYVQNSLIHDRSFHYGQVSIKLAQLLNFNTEIKNTYNEFLLSLPEPLPTDIAYRLDEINTLISSINQDLSTQIGTYITPEDGAVLSPQDYFSLHEKTISSIHSRQTTLVGLLADLDSSYVHN